jgi:hypothetical protein
MRSLPKPEAISFCRALSADARLSNTAAKVCAMMISDR